MLVKNLGSQRINYSDWVEVLEVCRAFKHMHAGSKSLLVHQDLPKPTVTLTCQGTKRETGLSWLWWCWLSGETALKSTRF